MGFKERLKEARLEKGYTQEQLAKLIGVAKSTFTGYEKGNSEPNMLTIKKIMDALEIDANYLWADEIDKDNSFVVSFSEQQLIKKYRNLDNHGIKAVESILNIEHDRCTTIKEEEPIYNSHCVKSFVGARLSAGTGQFVFDEVPTDLIEVPIEYDYIDFVIEVSGDSMEPDYFDGDKVMIVKQPKINVGEVGAFMINGEAYIKELGSDRLISQNREFDDIIFTEDMRIDCIGKVVGKL